ncbi:hypothetical protein M5362_17255 [Streptomyces sp. Je 1-79]|uniref:hypothetical protein n=1 Tax=Streptomyces sp. Je 1-79 TaxID=2943847 RepID=UPI0021A75F3B|nr:hypothetical protein [Streptomyces sp. Je 1-79]MCT4354879.1 hypothetical protein [Streptomyces sp. Je 1-79]
MRAAGSLAAAVGVAAVFTAAVLPGVAWAADEVPYAFDGGGIRVKGAASSLDARQLKAGQSYRDSIEKDGKLYYRVDLDDKQNAYVSVVAVPKAGGKPEYGDGIKVSLQDGSGSQCGTQVTLFESAYFTRPITAYAHRTIEAGSSTCQQAGAYYVLVERTSKAVSTPEDWEMEIRYVTEPGVKQTGPTELPENWPSSSPPPPAGGPQTRQGGAGFHDATSLTQGEWRTDIKPGQTLFYRVPVDWGQQLFATVELGSSPTGVTEYLSNALVLSLANPARGHVDQETVTYAGKPATLALDPLRPVAFENRYSSSRQTNPLRFAGWYYLSATLSPEVVEEYGDKPMPLTLRVNVTGTAKAGPAYDGDAGPFKVTDDDRDAAASGASGPQAGRSDSMALVAAAGIGAGTVLVVGLGVWTLAGRRRAARDAPQDGPPQFGPPTAW